MSLYQPSRYLILHCFLFFFEILKFLKCNNFGYYICESLKRGWSKQHLLYHGEGTKSIKSKRESIIYVLYFVFTVKYLSIYNMVCLHNHTKDEIMFDILM